MIKLFEEFTFFKKKKLDDEVDIEDVNFENRDFKPIKQYLNDYLVKRENSVSLEKLLELSDNKLLLQKFIRYFDRINLRNKNALIVSKVYRSGGVLCFGAWGSRECTRKYFDIVVNGYQVVGDYIYIHTDKGSVYPLDIFDVADMYVAGNINIPEQKKSKIDPYGEEDWDDN